MNESLKLIIILSISPGIYSLSYDVHLRATLIVCSRNHIPCLRRYSPVSFRLRTESDVCSSCSFLGYDFNLRKIICNYCEWDYCKSEQYCCGDNVCCDYVYSLWYFWVGIIFLILLVSACVGLFRSYYRSWSISRDGISFKSLPVEISDDDPLLQVRTDSSKPRHSYQE